MPRFTRFLHTTLISLSLLPVAALRAEDWPHWRGIGYDGVSEETGLRYKWDNGPPVAWSQKIGSAFSSLACAEGRVYTCGTDHAMQVLYCLDADSGRILWSFDIEKEYPDSWGDGARATPTVDSGRVYVQGAFGRLVCVDAKSGKLIWSRDYNARPQWGYSGSVLIDGDRAILSPGKMHGALLALNKTNGETIWKTGDDEAGYATPYPFEFQGRRYICGFVATRALVVEPADGRQAMSVTWRTDWNVNAATPIHHDGRLLLTSGYKTGSALYKLGWQAVDKTLSKQEVWRNEKLLNKFQTPVLYKGMLFTSDQSALSCLDFQSGEVKWRKPRIANGTLLAVDGHLILVTEEGELQIAEAGSADFVPVAKSQILSGKCWSAPILSNGRLYARDFEKAVCVDLRMKNAE